MTHALKLHLFLDVLNSVSAKGYRLISIDTCINASLTVDIIKPVNVFTGFIE